MGAGNSVGWCIVKKYGAILLHQRFQIFKDIKGGSKLSNKLSTKTNSQKLNTFIKELRTLRSA